MIPAFLGWTWAVKWYEVREITEEGVFTENQVPPDYGGSQLTVEVIQRLLVCTSEGYLQMLYFDDLKNVMDSERKTGLGVNIQPPSFSEESVTVVDPTGPSTEHALWYMVENLVLPVETQAKVIEMYKLQLLIQPT